MNTDINYKLAWQDALDDGSLTLRAEHLLLRLPEHAIPSYSCLYHPELINKLANDMGPAINQTALEFASELFVRVGTIFSDIGHLSGSESDAIIIELIEDEWLKLRAWLRAELSGLSDPDHTAFLQSA